MTRAALPIALLLAFASLAPAGELHGVTLPDGVTVEGKALKLNGMGVRTKMMFKVYVAGLYVETPSKDAKAVVAADQVKRIHMAIVRSLAAAKVTEAITDGFERNSAAELPALKERLDKLNAMIPDVAAGDTIVLTYVPAKGVVVEAKGAEKGVLPGKDFADALFSVWLGASPVQEDLKAALLGGA